MNGPAIPPPYLVYAIGDVHGRADLQARLLAMIDADLAQFPDRHVIKIFLGDYIDRGPASRAVMDRLVAERARAGQRVILLLGNHERLLLDFLDNPDSDGLWLQIGGAATVYSYGLVPPARPQANDLRRLRDQLRHAIPGSHLDLIRSLPLTCQLGDYIFVHAGTRPGIPLALQDPEDLLWIRDEFLRANHPAGQVIVHGHTPQTEVQTAIGRLGIDTGAFATGKLTAARLDGARRHILQTGG